MTPSAENLLVAPAAESQTESLARALWQHMDRDQRSQIFWDAEAEDKPDILRYALRASPLPVLAATPAGEPRAAAWLAPMTSGSKTAACHFAFAGPTQPAQRLDAGMKFLNLAFHQAELLLALLPAPWRGARELALALGFAPIVRLPKACFIQKYNRAVDGILMAVSK